jgi:uncharacterized membrane protein YfcA
MFGGIAGVLSGLLGVGGGFVMVRAPQRYTDLEAQSIVAASLAVISRVSLVGMATSASTGHVDLAVGLPFALGGAVGMGVGNLLLSRLAHLRGVFAFDCLAVATGMIAKSV